MSTGIYVEYPLFLFDFYGTWEVFFRQFFFSKNIQISNFMKIRPVGAELLHVDRRTDMTKLIVALRNFPNAPKMSGVDLISTNLQLNVSSHLSVNKVNSILY